MKILVVGGTGTIGQAVVNELKKDTKSLQQAQKVVMFKSILINDLPLKLYTNK